MTEDTFARCMGQIETRWRGMRQPWNAAAARSFGELLRLWEDYDGERAVRAWLYESEGSMDIAELGRIYRRLRGERRPDQAAEADRAATSDAYAEQRAGKRPAELMMEGFMARWRSGHGDAEPPQEWIRLFARIQTKRDAQRLDDDDPFAADYRPRHKRVPAAQVSQMEEEVRARLAAVAERQPAADPTQALFAGVES